MGDFDAGAANFLSAAMYANFHCFLFSVDRFISTWPRSVTSDSQLAGCATRHRHQEVHLRQQSGSKQGAVDFSV